jgi:hypothetical protein
MTEALKQALDAFERKERGIPQAHMAAQLVAELSTALTQATASEQGEPIMEIVQDVSDPHRRFASLCKLGDFPPVGTKLYTAQPTPAARPMTREQVNSVFDSLTPSGHGKSRYDIVAEVEAHHHIGSQPTAPAAPAERVEGYAGVIAWLGDKQVKAVLTEKQLDHERQPGFELSHTAAWCCANLRGAMEADNAERPEKDWWAKRNGTASAPTSTNGV